MQIFSKPKIFRIFYATHLNQSEQLPLIIVTFISQNTCVFSINFFFKCGKNAENERFFFVIGTIPLRKDELEQRISNPVPFYSK